MFIPYVRVSTAAQLDGYGPESQLEDIEAAAARLCLPLTPPVYDAITGKDEERPGFDGILQRIEDPDDAVSGVIVARVDRLARQLTTQEALLALVWRAGGRVFAANSGEVLPDDPDDPMRTLIRQIMGAIAEYDRKQLTANMRKGRKAKAARGKFIGGVPPFGWRVDPETHDFAPHPEEQTVINYARRLRFEEGCSLQGVADRLNEAGYRTARGKSWHPIQVSRILQPKKTGAPT